MNSASGTGAPPQGFGLHGFDEPFDGAVVRIIGPRGEAAVATGRDAAEKAQGRNLGFDGEMHHVVRDDALFGAIDRRLRPCGGDDIEPIILGRIAAAAFGEDEFHGPLLPHRRPSQ